jgi:hypothetical protein
MVVIEVREPTARKQGSAEPQTVALQRQLTKRHHAIPTPVFALGKGVTNPQPPTPNPEP